MASSVGLAAIEEVFLETDVPKKTRREYFAHPTIERAQKMHFFWVDLVPLLVSIFSVPILWTLGLSGIDVTLFIVIFFLTVVGIEIGYHRYFSHSSFEAHPIMQVVLHIFGAMGGQGPAIAWASNHRHHHKYSDQEGDSHSPHTGTASPMKRFLHSHILWKYQYRYPNPAFYTPALLKDSRFNRIDRFYYLWVIFGLILPGLLGFVLTQKWQGALSAFLFAGVIRLSFGQHLTWCINSVCHLLGTQDFRSNDNSRNISFLSWITLGGSLHNNHHAFPHLSRNDHIKGQIDPSYWILKVLSQFALVSELKQPSVEMLKKKRLM